MHLAMASALLALALAVAPRLKAAPADQQRLQGDWTLVEQVRDGKKATAAEIKGTMLHIDGLNWTISGNPSLGTSQGGTMTIDPAKSSKAMDSVQSAGPDKGKTFLGIYRLSGDQQSVCFAPPGKPRPTKFAAPAGSGCIYQIWKRKKS